MTMPARRGKQAAQQVQQSPGLTRQQQQARQSLFTRRVPRNAAPDRGITQAQWIPAVEPVATMQPTVPDIRGMAPRVARGPVASREYFESEILFDLELDVLALGTFNLIQTHYGDPKTSEAQLYYDVKHLYAEFMDQFLPWITDPDRAIVPKDTGDLRNAIIASLQGNAAGTQGTFTRVGNLHPFMVLINMGRLQYAQWVVQMPAEWLQHTGAKHTRTTKSSRTQRRGFGRNMARHRLWDPNAQEGFFDVLIHAGRSIWRRLWDTYLHGQFAQYFDKTLTAMARGPRNPSLPIIDLPYLIITTWHGGVP